ncbi:hypothetical protein [Massilia yuzhufengensis]|uniref:Uncharacterized protein n=1 Tax=Massilia yuzhufengensis TaxID=1164594 RepID=A0A1I1PKS2_9BURK|nr:hypothetical protein [Massilia yuzhufengensis]SFD10464.1 hypothetical protein SAMN05216204_11649 [Massilia yuzhufengensis]
MIFDDGAAYPRRAPGWPLLATLGLHLLLAWSWRIAHPPALDTREERVFDVIALPPPAREVAQFRPPPARDAGTRKARANRPPGAPVREAEPITPPSETPAPAADPLAVAEPAAPAESALDAMVGRARRDAGPIDRELRKGKSGVPAVADTPWGRFRQALEGAHKDTARSLASDTYTAPDGQVIYRFRQGGKIWCRTSGSVKPRIGGAEGGGATMFDTRGGEGSAGTIRCPSHGEWKRD